jgi:hypothetical protein
MNTSVIHAGDILYLTYDPRPGIIMPQTGHFYKKEVSNKTRFAQKVAKEIIVTKVQRFL